MKRSNPKRYARTRFPGQRRGTIGAIQQGNDTRQERARLIAIIAQQSGSEPGRMQIMMRRLAQGKRV